MKVLKILGIGVGSILVLGLIVTGSMAGQRPPNRLRVITQLDGFKLGESKSDVEFKHGNISVFVGLFSDLIPDDANRIRLLDEESRTYVVEHAELVFDKNANIEKIKISCSHEGKPTIINGVRCFDSGETVIKVIPNILRYCYAGTNLARDYEDAGRNVTYGMWKNSVEWISIRTPNYKPIYRSPCK